MLFRSLVLARQRIGIQAEWRRWLTDRLVGRWLGERTYYKLEVSSGGVDNPEARMSEDLKQALSPIVDMAVGLFNALLAAATFIGVLAFVGREVSLPIGRLTSRPTKARTPMKVAAASSALNNPTAMSTIGDSACFRSSDMRASGLSTPPEETSSL